jgi:hypothetical protein
MTTATKTNFGISRAIATPTSATVFNVRYPGHADCDCNVSYEYLRGLVRRGIAVTVESSPYGPAQEVSAD